MIVYDPYLFSLAVLLMLPFYMHLSQFVMSSLVGLYFWEEIVYDCGLEALRDWNYFLDLYVTIC